MPLVFYLTTPAFLFGGAGVVSALATAFAVVAVALNEARAAIAASVFAAIRGFFFNSAVKLHSELRERSATMLQAFRNDPALLEAQRQVGDDLRTQNGPSQVNVEAINEIFKYYSERREDTTGLRDGLLKLLNDFDSLSIEVRHGEILEPIIHDFYVGSLLRTWALGAPFVAVLRTVEGRDIPHFGVGKREDAFIGVSWLVERWRPTFEHRVARAQRARRRTRHRGPDRSKSSL